MQQYDAGELNGRDYVARRFGCGSIHFYPTKPEAERIRKALAKQRPGVFVVDRSDTEEKLRVLGQQADYWRRRVKHLKRVAALMTVFLIGYAFAIWRAL